MGLTVQHVKCYLCVQFCGAWMRIERYASSVFVSSSVVPDCIVSCTLLGMLLDIGLPLGLR